MKEIQIPTELLIIDFFKLLESKNIDISEKTNKYLLEKYYIHLGLTKKSTLNEWFKGLASKKYKPYSEIESAIKKARNYDRKWIRDIN